MRVFYYFKSYEFFLNKLKFSLFDSQKLNINKKVGEETLKQSSPTNFFLFCQYNRQFIRGPPSFQIEKIWKEKNMKGPKRRKFKDNPYTLLYEDNTNKYYLLFKDGNNIVEVSEKVFNAFNSFELENKSQMNKYDRHIELYAETLYKRTKSTYENLDDEYIEKSSYEDLIEAINHLPVVVKRRIKMFMM